MPRLRDRNRFPPNGFRFYQPETKFEPPRHLSFNSTVEAVINHRKGNPWLATQHGWSTDFETVANEIDLYNTKLCQQMGWTDFIMDGGGGAEAIPFPHPLPNRLKSVAAGANTLVEWLKDGAEAVPATIADNRAATCVACPKNGQGDWTRWFTAPVSEAIRKEVERRKDMKLSTPHDGQLGVCEVCLCPLKLKVHIPIDQIRNNLSKEILGQLPPNCWIPKE